MQVEIFLNTNPRDSMFYGYREHDTLVLAASYEVACPGEGRRRQVSDSQLLEDAFRRFNIGADEGDPIAVEYVRNGHRSLSVGDIVVINRRPDLRLAFACLNTGWSPVSEFRALRTPDEWSTLLGWVVLDPDGWRLDGKAWTAPVTKGEFERRAGLSTAKPPAAEVVTLPDAKPIES